MGEQVDIVEVQKCVEEGGGEERKKEGNMWGRRVPEGD